MNNMEAFCIFDDEGILLFEKYKWRIYTHKTKNKLYKYLVRYEHRKPVLFHRNLMRAKKGEVVDHINRNTLDNRKDNLRIGTHSLNMKNRSVSSNSKTGIRGVFWDKSKQKWKAAIQNDGTKHTLGYFNDIEEARKVYEAASHYYHGFWGL